MPFDQKRINGPESSTSYRQYITVDEKKKKREEICDKREDGRAFDEHRKFAVQMNAISKAKGSCYIENGNTKIICGVFELREIPRNSRYADKGQLYIDFKYAPFSRETRKGFGESDDKLISNNIKSALESLVCLHEFPNYQIDVFILVLEDDGGVLSTSLTAAGVAFVDACIPCFDLLTSSSVAFVNGKILVDPTSREEEILSNLDNQGTMTVSSLNSMDQISQILFSGHVDPELVKQAKKTMLEVNKSNAKYLKKVISSKIIKENSES